MGYEGDSCGECGNFTHGAQRDLHEVRYLWRYQWLFLTTVDLPRS